jgi:hypothetical protein
MSLLCGRFESFAAGLLAALAVCSPPIAAYGKSSLQKSWVHSKIIPGGDLEPTYPDINSPVDVKVTATCMIETDGRATNCHIDSNTGARAFADNTLAWLTGPTAPHFAPATRDGTPQREAHQMVINFPAALQTVDVYVTSFPHGGLPSNPIGPTGGARVVFSCIYDKSDLPHDCRIVSNTGIPVYAAATLAWLNSPNQDDFVFFEMPDMRTREALHPVARQFVVTFAPNAKPDLQALE